MNLQQLEYFIAVAENKGYHNAAQKLFVSQPTLSCAIKKLEESFDVILFKQKGRTIELTDAGKELYRYAKKIQQSCVECKRAMQGFTGDSNNTIRIGMPIYYSYNDYLQILTEFKATHPQIIYSFVNHNSAELVHDLKIGDIDLAIMIDVPQTADEDIKTVALRDEERCVFISRLNPLSQRSSVTLADLKDELFLFFDEEVKNRYKEEMKAMGFGINTFKKVFTMPLLFDLVAVNQGIFVSFKNCAPVNEQVVSVPLVGDNFFSHTILATLKNGKKNSVFMELYEFIVNRFRK